MYDLVKETIKWSFVNFVLLVSSIETGIEIYNGYLLLDVGDYTDQEKLTIDLSCSSPKQIQDQGKISLLLYNSNKTEILSRADY